ncbi:IclR family transcriptional regulator domain-containing protein, partial [Bacillus velezensis]|uniref:IclR family transcriptional regulator domain-containing protein n=1 Tax=Bacillus velezensis TaxID=492670 RepID=UPI0024BE95CD
SIIIDRIDSPKNVRIIDMIGEKIPYPIGAANKVLLAFSSKEIQATFSENYEVTEQLQQIKEMGYSISYDEKTKGTVSVAAPVFDLDEKPIAAISA